MTDDPDSEGESLRVECDWCDWTFTRKDAKRELEEKGYSASDESIERVFNSHRIGHEHFNPPVHKAYVVRGQDE